MAFLLFILCAGCLIFILSLDDLRIRKQLQKLEYALSESLKALRNAGDTERKLQQDMDTLRANIHSISTDPVTRLPGWQLFEDRLVQCIKESARYQITMAVLFIDIDDFKVINSALGRDVGDQLLLQVAERLQTCVRQVDSIGRYNKDTFVALLTQLAKPETAAIVAQRMLQALAQPFQIQEQEVYITVGIGIAIFPADGVDMGALSSSAEHAMRVAKEKGKHIYQFSQDQNHVQSQRELTLSNSLRRDSIPQEFTVYYQPVKNMDDNSVFCMNALLHWRHEDMGLIDQDELYRSAARQGKLNPLTEWLLEHACKQYAVWQAEDFHPQYLCIPLNISQLENNHFIYRLSQLLQELKFNPERLILELKDSGKPYSLEVMEKAFNMLKYMNIKLALADFGGGSFSLRNLKSLSVDFLWLDEALTRDIADNPKSAALVKSAVYLADTLSMQCIAQGVDTQAQLDVLRETGCRLVQGGLAGRPQPESESPQETMETN